LSEGKHAGPNEAKMKGIRYALARTTVTAMLARISHHIPAGDRQCGLWGACGKTFLSQR